MLITEQYGSPSVLKVGSEIDIFWDFSKLTSFLIQVHRHLVEWFAGSAQSKSWMCNKNILAKWNNKNPHLLCLHRRRHSNCEASENMGLNGIVKKMADL